MKKWFLLAAVGGCVAVAPASAATFSVEHGVGPDACNSASSTGPFATGQVITYSNQSCLGGYSAFLDTARRTITFTTANAPFADYRFSEFNITGIEGVTITSLSILKLAPLFNTANNPAPTPQLSFTANSIYIFFGERSFSAPIFDFSTDGGQAIFAYNGGVPEPATWAMMIAGFGLAGAATRRRRMTLSFS